MDEPDIYGSTSYKGRRNIEEPDKEMGEPMEQEDNDETADDETADDETDRRRRRDRRRGLCRCQYARRRTRSRRRRRKIVSQNPFIIFYLEMYYKMPGKRVAEVARQAGKEWCSLPEEERKKYVQLAERERRRRRRRLTRRRRRV